MTKKIGLLFLFGFLYLLSVNAQHYRVNCTNMPLSDLLVELRREYNLQLSFNHRLLSTYTISLKGAYNTPESLLEALLKDIPLSCEKINGVFVIYPSGFVENEPPFLLSGQVRESGSGEPLPFSHILVDNLPLVSDLKGSFSFSAPTDSLLRVKVSHLGCFILDTLLQPGGNHVLYLTPFAYSLPEVKVRDTRVERSVQLGESAGLIKLNSYIAGYLPGNGDNSVFNLLRLQPGILAAGEQPNDLIIQGSPEGTSRVLFDGFTIWGLKNFNDNISAVNPYLAKTILVHKSGYDASSPDLTGGIVDITGPVGSIRKAGVNLFVNNQTVNGMVELPLFQKSSLILALRQTYYNLFGEEDLKLPRTLAQSTNYRLDVIPDYRFRDMNVKYSMQGDNGDLFYVSFLRGSDRFSYEVSQEREHNLFSQTNREDNIQTGASLLFAKNWSYGSRSGITAAFSSLNSDYNLYRSLKNFRFNRVFPLRDETSQTHVEALDSKLEHHLNLGPKHSVDLGVEAILNRVTLLEDTFGLISSDITRSGLRAVLFAQDKIRLTSALSLMTGIRVNYLPRQAKFYPDPRVDLTAKLGSAIKLNAAWGLYHQFLIKSSVVDENGNYRYTWSLANNGEIPVLRSEHRVGGVTFFRNDFTVSAEAYYKNTSGLTRYVRSRSRQEMVFTGESRSYGLDFMVKKDLHRHSFWASYTMGRAEELFPYFPENEYRRAPHDQRHELKTTALVSIGNFFISGVWVFGTGFPLYTGYLNRHYTEPDYNRLDLSLIYHLRKNKFEGEAGLSVMNLFDVSNVKYSSFERIPVDQLNTVYINADAMPFTPLVFLKVAF